MRPGKSYVHLMTMRRIADPEWRSLIDGYLGSSAMMRVSARTMPQKERHLFKPTMVLPPPGIVKADELEAAIQISYGTPHSFNRCLADWWALYSWAHRVGRSRFNVAKPIKKLKIRCAKEGSRWELVERDIVYKMFPDDEVMRHFVRFQFWTGCRPEHCTRFRPEHVRLRPKPHVFVYGGKTRDHNVPLIHGDAADAAVYLFVDNPGCLPKTQKARLEAVQAEYARRAPEGAPRISLESFRKTRLSWYVSRYPMADVARWTGTSISHLLSNYQIVSADHGAWPSNET